MRHMFERIGFASPLAEHGLKSAPNQQQGGGRGCRQMREAAQRRSGIGSFRARCIGDGNTRHRCGNSAAEQRCGHLGQILPRHVDGQGSIGGQGARPQFRLGYGARGMVAAQYNQPRRDSAIGERSLQKGGRRGCRSHSRHHFKRHPSLTQGVDLLGSTAENHGVAGFQPDHGQPPAGRHNHQVMDGGLGDLLPPATLAYADDQGLLAGQVEDGLRIPGRRAARRLPPPAGGQL